MDRITITLKEYFSGGYTLPDNISLFEKLNIDGNIYDIENMFVDRNLYKEIGSETQELFKHNLKNLINEALVEYNPKLKLLNENYKDLMTRTVEETTESGTETANENKNYLVPSNTNAEKLQDMGRNNGAIKYSEKKTKSYAWLDSNAKILELSLKINMVINSILSHLDKAFIGEY